MTQQIINVGVAPDDGKMDKLRVAFAKFNQNFTELYGRLAPPGSFAHAAGIATVSGVGSSSVVAGFDPTSLFASGETGGWWDPSDMSSMFQDTAGTVPVNATNQQVARINDKSGNGNHLLQATSGNRPFLQASGSFKYLAFDGVSENLGKAFTEVQPTTRVNAVRAVTWVSGTALFDGGTDSSSLLYFNGAAPEIDMYAGVGLPDVGDLTVGADHATIEVFNGASSSFQADNVTATSGNAGAAGAGGLTIGSVGAGLRGYANVRWYGGISIGRLLTTGETNNCRTFFGAKAGLVL